MLPTRSSLSLPPEKPENIFKNLTKITKEMDIYIFSHCKIADRLAPSAVMAILFARDLNDMVKALGCF